MVTEIRKRFNAEFTGKKYESFLHDLNTLRAYPPDFRVAETPVFLPQPLTDKLIAAGTGVLTQLRSEEFRSHSRNAVPPGFNVLHQSDHPEFLQIDFAICRDDDGSFCPRLIELQAFPSLYCYQHFLDERMRAHFSIPNEQRTYFGGLDGGSYIELLKKTILAGHSPGQVVLLEIDPEIQKTRIDFACTEHLLGVRTVSITDVIKRGNKLYYRGNKGEVPIERIYNRVIFDELARKRRPLAFQFADELDVSWAGHPNWYFLISKHSLPFLKGSYVPRSVLLQDASVLPQPLDRYVLKPLFSFAGSGVHVDLTEELLDSVEDRGNYILQEKVEYAPAVETPDGYARVEIRMMYLWHHEPVLVNNLVRMSKGKMMGVNYNKDKSWVGSSLAYHS